MLLSSNSPSPVMSVQKFDDAHISCEDSSGTGENDDLSMISLIAKLMSLVLSRAAPSKCSSLLGNISLSVLRLQSGCALAVLAPSVLKFSVPTEDSMDGRSSSESSLVSLNSFKDRFFFLLVSSRTFISLSFVRSFPHLGQTLHKTCKDSPHVEQNMALKEEGAA